MAAWFNFLFLNKLPLPKSLVLFNTLLFRMRNANGGGGRAPARPVERGARARRGAALSRARAGGRPARARARTIPAGENAGAGETVRPLTSEQRETRNARDTERDIYARMRNVSRERITNAPQRATRTAQSARSSTLPCPAQPRCPDQASFGPRPPLPPHTRNT